MIIRKVCVNPRTEVRASIPC